MDNKSALEALKWQLEHSEDSSLKEAIEILHPELVESGKEKIRKEINTLYSDIDDCISELLAARTNRDTEAEGKALFRMEGLMVGTLQDLSCIEDYLKSEKGVEPPTEEKLGETYLAVFDKKYPNLPTLKGKELHDFKNFLNTCRQVFGLTEYGIHPTQSKLFEKLALLWATWGAKHLNNNSGKVVAFGTDAHADGMYGSIASGASEDEDKDLIQMRNEDFDNGRKEVMAHPEAYGLRKITEWSEQDRYNMEDAITALDLINTAEFEKEQPNLSVAFQDAKAWLKDLPGRFMLPPKPQWNEEDGNLIKLMIEILRKNFKKGETIITPYLSPKGFMTRDEIIERIQRLTPIVKENDRYMEGYWDGYKKATETYNNTVAFHYDSPNVYTPDPNLVIESQTNGSDPNVVIESKTIHWKPSEEQVLALKWQLDHPDLVKWRKSDLESLYNDIKKL